MPTFKSGKIEKLPILLNPPLLEAIFELRWGLQQDTKTGRVRDPAYPMLVGRLYERFKKDFPFTEDLPSVQAHPETAPFVPRHRMRKDKDSYPLMQIGPGIITLNHAKGYSWSDFKERILRVLEAVQELQTPPLNFIKSELRYVNGIRFDLARENPLAFLSEKLHTKVELDPEFFMLNGMQDRPNGVGVNLSYVLDKPVGFLGISANLGHVDNKNAYIVQIGIQSFAEMVPSDAENFAPWLDEAHNAAEHSFKVFCKGPLMKQFCESE